MAREPSTKRNHKTQGRKEHFPETPTWSKSSYIFGPNSLIDAATSLDNSSLMTFNRLSVRACPGARDIINGRNDLGKEISSI